MLAHRSNLVAEIDCRSGGDNVGQKVVNAVKKFMATQRVEPKEDVTKEVKVPAKITKKESNADKFHEENELLLRKLMKKIAPNAAADAAMTRPFPRLLAVDEGYGEGAVRALCEFEQVPKLRLFCRSYFVISLLT